MSGLLRRLTSRRPPTAGGDDARPADDDGPAATPGPGDSAAAPGGSTGVVSPGRTSATSAGTATAEHAAGEPATGAGPESTAGPVLPAGLDPQELAARPEPTARRSRLRRRLRFLRAAREVLLRDLGGFVLELHRTAGDVEQPEHRRLREAKLARLLAVEEEARAIEGRLGEATHTVVIREPGLGGECPRCRELLASDARFCSHCGLAVQAAPAPAGERGDTAGGRTGEAASGGAAAGAGTAGADTSGAERDPSREATPQPTSPTRPIAPGEAPAETVPVTGERDPYAAPAERRG